jgi:hypothetical protein
LQQPPPSFSFFSSPSPRGASCHCADNVGRQYRETEEPRRVGWNDAFGFGNILKRQASICEKLITDCVGTDEQTHKASVGSCGLRAIVDDDPHLLARAFEASRNRQRCPLAIGFGSGFFNRLGLLGCFVKAPTDPILIQHDINAIRVDLDAHNAGAHQCAEAFDPSVMLGKISRTLDQPLLGYGVGNGLLNGLKDRGGVGKPVANPTDDKGFKGGRRDSLALLPDLADPKEWVFDGTAAKANCRPALCGASKPTVTPFGTWIEF